MLGNMITAILAVVFLYMLCEAVWVHVIGSDTQFIMEKSDTRTFLEKGTFSVMRFCDRLCHTSEYRRTKLEESFSGWKDDDII